MLTRREACVLLGALGASALGTGALGLAGCGLSETDSDPTSKTGLSSDTEVKSYPVHLKIYVDSYIQWHLNPYQTPPPAWQLNPDKPLPQEILTRLDAHITRYQQQKDRSEVSFEMVYVDSAELLSWARGGFPDGDGLLAFESTVLEGCASGVVDAGVANLYVRDLGYHYSENVCLARAVGSDATLPPAATLTGEDASDGTINHFQQLPSFDGLLALADPTATLEGLLANRALAAEGFYSEPSGLGGTYSDSVVAKIVSYPNQDAAMAAVAAGECQLGFALYTALATRYPGMEKVYAPQYGQVFYDGAALSHSAERGVMRDFFEFVTRCSD
jgi:hypothetical protein